MNAAQEVLQGYLSLEKVTLVDVGALGGVKAPWSDVRPLLRVIGFEPQDGVTQTVRKENGDIQGGVTIGAKEGVGILYITQKPDNSSLAVPNHAFTNCLGVGDRFIVTHEESVNVMPLDTWLKQENIPTVDFLKIDTQGTEGDVLEGARETLASVLGLDIEINFAKRYKGQSYFSDIDAMLRTEGFVLFDLQRRYLKYAVGVRFGEPKGQLTHGTALYLRSIESFGALLKKQNDEHAARLLAVFLMIITLYGYYDYALAILKEYGKMLPENIRGKIEHSFQTELSWSERFPRFSLRFRIARALDTLAKTVRPYSRLGTYGDDTLGNL